MQVSLVAPGNSRACWDFVYSTCKWKCRLSLALMPNKLNWRPYHCHWPCEVPAIVSIATLMMVGHYITIQKWPKFGVEMTIFLLESFCVQGCWSYTYPMYWGLELGFCSKATRKKCLILGHSRFQLLHQLSPERANEQEWALIMKEPNG